VLGAVAVNKLLRQLPDEIQASVKTELHRAGPEILSRIRARAPRKTGALDKGLAYKVYDKTFRLVVGLIGTKRQRSRLFYAKIQEFGRKASVKTVTRGGVYAKNYASLKAAGARVNSFKATALRLGLANTYQMHVRAMPGKRFITGRMPDLRSLLQSNLKGIWSRALRKLNTGGSQ
jgi:hypothetical protein